MSDRANINSVEALETFRSQLIVYLSKVRPALEDVSSDVRRAKMWLEDEQWSYWENQRRRRAREFEEATQAAFTAKLAASIADLRDVSAAEAMRVVKAKRSLDEADAKLRKLKEWRRRFDSLAFPLVKQMEKFQTVLSHDLKLAIASLGETIKIVDSYAERGSLSAPVSSPVPQPPDAALGQDGSASPPIDPGGKIP